MEGGTLFALVALLVGLGVGAAIGVRVGSRNTQAQLKGNPA